MADRKQPQPFRPNLFASPSSSLSMGFGDDAFSSPLSLAPALSTGGSSPFGGVGPHQSSPNIQQPSTSAPHSSPSPSPQPPSQPQPFKKSPSGTPVNQSPKPERKAIVGGIQPGTVSTAELSTVPLDSPNTTTSSPATMATPEVYRSVSEPVVTGSGWNDPPMLYSQTPKGPIRSATTGTGTTHLSEPSLHPSPDNYPIQPLARRPGPTNADVPSPLPATTHVPLTNPAVTSHGGPHPPVAAQMGGGGGGGGGGGNPYRMGTVGGARKLTYTSTTSAFSGGPYPPMGPPPQPISQPMMGPVPTSQVAPPLSQPTMPPATQAHPPSLTSPELPLSLPQPSTFPAQPSQQWSGGPVVYHWFYLRSGETYWIPFSHTDSARLEEALIRSGQDTTQEVLVHTDGGRYDVRLDTRTRQAVFWEEPPSQVRRCSWFYKGERERWYLPYEEDIAARLEEEYLSAVSQGSWNRRVDLSGGEAVIMHSTSAMVHYPSSHFKTSIDHEEDYTHPKSVLRGFKEVDKVEQGEQSRVDHLVFVVHGIGPHCDLDFRSLIDCVDDFREVSQLMLQTHRFSKQVPRDGDTGGRVEFLPVHWHAALHGDDTGVDCRLQPLTLPSISRLRDFTNSTLLDILFYTSPIYCQTIVNQVASEMNRMLELFRQRNPGFQGGISVMGHSLGSCVLFDILDHQHRLSETIPQELTLQDTSSQGEGEGEDEPDQPPTLEGSLIHLGLTDHIDIFHKERIDFESLIMCTNDDLKELGIAMGPRKKLSSYITEQAEKQRIAKGRKAKEEAERLVREREMQRLKEQEAADQSARLQGVKFVKGIAGTGQPFVEYPQLNFEPQHLFAVGSPIGLFLTVRGVEDLGSKFHLPTCSHVFNIFHPFDPVAYRVEPLVCDTSAPDRPVQMPHHKGRKRFHLELYDNLGHMGARFKQSIVEGMRNMWSQLNEIARSHTTPYGTDQVPKEQTDALTENEATPVPEPDPVVEPLIGQLNQGRRIDHVLQEKPIEKLNEYLFALSSHLCYWRSEDTALFILKEVYNEPNAELIKS